MLTYVCSVERACHVWRSKQALQMCHQRKIKGSESLMAWPVSRGRANGGALFWWNWTKKILGLVGQTFYSHTEGIAHID